jgi:hypothetical protein
MSLAEAPPPALRTGAGGAPIVAAVDTAQGLDLAQGVHIRRILAWCCRVGRGLAGALARRRHIPAEARAFVYLPPSWSKQESSSPNHRAEGELSRPGARSRGHT